MTRREKEDLLREAVEILIKLDNHMMTSRDNAEFSQWVEDLIEQQQRTGRWIATEDGFECSECGCISRSRADFCQYCGAKMKEGD